MTGTVPAPRTIYIEELLPLVGTAMLADCDPQPVELELVEATPLRNFAQLDRPPFILIFRSSPEAMLVDGHYAMRAPGFGPDHIYIAQIAKPLSGPPGHYYQSVFN